MNYRALFLAVGVACMVGLIPLNTALGSEYPGWNLKISDHEINCNPHTALCRIGVSITNSGTQEFASANISLLDNSGFTNISSSSNVDIYNIPQGEAKYANFNVKFKELEDVEITIVINTPTSESEKYVFDEKDIEIKGSLFFKELSLTYAGFSRTTIVDELMPQDAVIVEFIGGACSQLEIYNKYHHIITLGESQSTFYTLKNNEYFDEFYFKCGDTGNDPLNNQSVLLPLAYADDVKQINLLDQLNVFSAPRDVVCIDKSNCVLIDRSEEPVIIHPTEVPENLSDSIIIVIIVPSGIILFVVLHKIRQNWYKLEGEPIDDNPTAINGLSQSAVRGTAHD